MSKKPRIYILRYIHIEFFSGELLQIENKIENSGVVPTIIVLHTKYNINDIELGRR